MLYLYHATDKQNIESIFRDGLLCNPPIHNWRNLTTNLPDDYVFLALNAEAAKSYVESQDNPPEEITVLKIKLDDLDEHNISYDWNNRCEYHEDINSVVYCDDINSNYLTICDAEKEPFQDIDDFYDTWLYEKIMETFKEEVESNLEL